MSRTESIEFDLEQADILHQLMADLLPGYDPPMSYHNWEVHILRGLERIDELEASGKATDVQNWFVVRAAYIGHDVFLTSTKEDPSLLEGFGCAEELSAEKTSEMLRSYGVDEETVSQVHYAIMATNPNAPCETPEARAVCRADIGNIGDNFDEFFKNFVLVQLEDKRVDQLIMNPLAVVRASCEFLSMYMKRSTLSLGPEDDFPTRVEQNFASIRSMGAMALRASIFRYLRHEDQEPGETT